MQKYQIDALSLPDLDCASGLSCSKAGQRYPLDSAIGCRNTYPLDSDLSGGQRYPAFKQPGPDWLCHVGNFLQPITSTTQIWVVTFCSKINNGAVKCELFSQAAENPDNFHLGWKKSSVVFFPYIFVLITKDHEQVYNLTFISQSMFHQVKCQLSLTTGNMIKNKKLLNIYIL